MLNSNAPRNRLRGGVILLCALAFLGIASVRAGEVEEAQKLLKAGQAPQALERVNRALAANPKDPQARFLKGLIFTEQGKQQEAIDIFTKLTLAWSSECMVTLGESTSIWIAFAPLMRSRRVFSQASRASPPGVLKSLA